jgi:hypothetical protein
MDRFEEYKFFGGWIESLSERRRAISTIYLSVNTGIFTVFAFLVKDAGFRGWSFVLVSLPLFAAGVLASLVWHRIITDYKQVIGWHYEQLRDMETTLEGCSQTFTREWERFYRPEKSRPRYCFSDLEIWLPRSFMGLYAVYAIGIVLATLVGLT